MSGPSECSRQALPSLLFSPRSTGTPQLGNSPRQSTDGSPSLDLSAILAEDGRTEQQIDANISSLLHQIARQ
eukprot:1705762-Rhodomonas_salina.1